LTQSRETARRSDWLRRYLIDRFYRRGLHFEQLMTDDEALEAFIRKAGIACGTLAAPAAWARWRSDGITDIRAGCAGVSGIASRRRLAVPAVPCANTNFPP